MRSRPIRVAGDGDDHAGLGAGLEERAVLVERGPVEAFVDEHDDELGRRLELAPVALLPELADVVAHLGRVPRHVGALQLDVVGVDRVEIGADRHLGVDDDALAARQLDDQVGAKQPAFVVALALLGAEVAVVDHARELDDALQLHLAPAAADVRRAERGDEAARLGAEALLPLGDRAQLLADRRDRPQALLLERLRLRLEAAERLLDRRELRVGELEQRRLALQQRVAGRGLEPLLPLAVTLLGGADPARRRRRASRAPRDRRSRRRRGSRLRGRRVP